MPRLAVFRPFASAAAAAVAVPTAASLLALDAAADAPPEQAHIGSGSERGPWEQALRAARDFEVVSTVTHVDPADLARTNLLADFPLKVQLLGLGIDRRQWTNLRKLALLHEHTAHLPPDKVVFVVDFFDVVWLGCERDLVDSFRSFGTPLVFGAELYPYPLTNSTIRRLPGGTYPTLPGRRLGGAGGVDVVGQVDAEGRWRLYRHLNSGCIAGYASALTRATARILANGFDNEYVLRTPLARTAAQRRSHLVGSDDQVAWHSYALRHPEEVALDYGARLFFNALGFDLPDFDLVGVSGAGLGRIWAKAFSRDLCFAHGNGATNVARHLADARRLGAQPGDCAEEVQSGPGGSRHYQLVCVRRVRAPPGV